MSSITYDAACINKGLLHLCPASITNIFPYKFKYPTVSVRFICVVPV